MPCHSPPPPRLTAASFPVYRRLRLKTHSSMLSKMKRLNSTNLRKPQRVRSHRYMRMLLTAVKKAVHSRYPGLKVMGYMESGGTDGMHFRKAGIPTLAVSGVFMNPDEMYAHGLNERVPVKAFYDALDHWSIILRELATN